MVSSEAPSCRPGMPTAAQLLRDPALGSLQYRNRVNYEATRGAGYDVWADAKFDYKAALQISLVPDKGARAGEQFCAQDVALRLALPLDDARREMLRGPRPACRRDRAQASAAREGARAADAA